MQQTEGASFMGGLPFGNTLVNVHLDLRNSDVDGTTHDFRTEWRLQF